jgi:two-component system cell cycle sensor histidine kinase/response regulator CckA
VISDVILRDSDGPSVRAIGRERFPALPCLFITGHADEIVAPRGMLREDVELLRKPFTAHQLVAKVGSVLQRERARKAPAPAQA